MTLRIGIYNRWLATLGGGERYMLALALALAEQGHAVELLSQQLMSAEEIERRLALQVGHLAQRQLEDNTGGGPVTEASADYDLFICASHGEILPSLGARNWMVVFFPEADFFQRRDSPWPRPYIWRGCYAEERDAGGQPFRWLAPEGAIWLPSWASTSIHIEIERPLAGSLSLWLEPMARWAPQGAPRQSAQPLHAQRTIALTAGSSAGATLRLAHGGEEGVLLRWKTEPLALDDPRALGTRLLDLSCDPPRRWLGPLRRQRQLPLDGPDQEWALSSYDRLLSISPYTTRWIRRRWGENAELLPPAVPLLEPGAKRPLILSVGRFFQGLHAKRQDALIAAFRQLQPVAPGWELHLAGGVDAANAADQRYLAELRAAAAGLPITFHVDVPVEELRGLYAQAQIYWHAAGYGSDPELRPEAQEHFGIAPVEAMSAGAVPLVYASGGPSEVVRDGVDGLHWRELDELARRSAALIADPRQRQALAQSARRRAEEYGPDAFARRVAELVETIRF